ncbi:MAG: helix-turn-helix domain-containing protein [Pseudomonas sp.]
MQTLDLIETQLKEALSANDWAKLDRIRDRVMSLVLRIVSGESNVDIALVRDALQNAFAFGSTLPDFDSARNRSTGVWLVAEQAHLASLAEALLPKNGADLDGSAKDRMLSFLSAANAKLSNKTLADRCGVTPETVARVLPLLRDQGLVRSRRVGRTMVNEITDVGRERMRERARGGMNLNLASRPRSRAQFDVAQSHVPPISAPLNNTPSLNPGLGNRISYGGSKNSADIQHRTIDHALVLERIKNYPKFPDLSNDFLPKKVHASSY